MLPSNNVAHPTCLCSNSVSVAHYVADVGVHMTRGLVSSWSAPPPPPPPGLPLVCLPHTILYSVHTSLPAGCRLPTLVWATAAPPTVIPSTPILGQVGKLS